MKPSECFIAASMETLPKKKKEKFINVDEEWEKVDQGHEQVVDWRGKREM